MNKSLQQEGGGVPRHPFFTFRMQREPGVAFVLAFGDGVENDLADVALLIRVQDGVGPARLGGHVFEPGVLGLGADAFHLHRMAERGQNINFLR